MSSNSTTNALEQDIIAQTPSEFISNYIALSAAVLLLYDYFLTFRLEQRHIWQGKINATKILFIMNRYGGLIFYYALVLNYFFVGVCLCMKSDCCLSLALLLCRCRAFYYLDEIASTAATVAITSVFGLRTYAIFGKSKIVFVTLAISGFLTVVSNIWLTVVQTTAALPSQLQFGPWTCNFSVSSSLYRGFDALVVILTVWRTGRIALESRKAKIDNSLSFILLSDGVLYYSAVFVPSFIIVVLNAIVVRTGSIDLNDVSSAMTTANDALQIVIVNRLVLNLIHTANADEDSVFRTRTGLEPPTFATGPFLGSIGGRFSYRPDDFDGLSEKGDERVDESKAEGNTAESTSAYETEELKGNVILSVNAEIEEVSV